MGVFRVTPTHQNAHACVNASAVRDWESDWSSSQKIDRWTKKAQYSQMVLNLPRRGC